MSFSDTDELLQEAREFFEQAQYSQAESILNQLVLKSHKSPEIFQMLGTIFYDRGQFNKAIRSYKRALEIDPSYTDASIGLSIILNDLGRYDEGQKIFQEAKVMFDGKAKDEDSYANEKLSIKHDELGEMYFRYQRYQEALDQYLKALNLSKRKAELKMKLVECFLKTDQHSKAVGELKDLMQEYPEFNAARIKLGQVYYSSGQVVEATELWEQALSKDPNNQVIVKLLGQAQSVGVTKLSETNL